MFYESSKKHESVNLLRLKQTAKQNALQDSQKEKTAEAIRKAEKISRSICHFLLTRPQRTLKSSTQSLRLKMANQTTSFTHIVHTGST